MRVQPNSKVRGIKNATVDFIINPKETLDLTGHDEAMARPAIPQELVVPRDNRLGRHNGNKGVRPTGREHL